MSNFIGSLFGEVTDQSADVTMATSSMASVAAAANAYLNATLTSTTPEVRRLFGEYTTQNLMAHEAITNLSIKKNWMSPNATPEQQLQISLEQSRSAIEQQ